MYESFGLFRLLLFLPNIMGIKMAIVAGTIPALIAANMPADLSGSFFDANTSKKNIFKSI